jgi:hypothetical protein
LIFDENYIFYENNVLIYFQIKFEHLVYILDVNDNAPQFHNLPYTLKIDEVLFLTLFLSINVSVNRLYIQLNEHVCLYMHVLGYLFDYIVEDICYLIIVLKYVDY